MGSHGQSTGAGQKEILESLGITAEAIHAPIRSSMKVKYLGKTAHQVPVYIDQHAFHADSIIVINRVCEHTDFEGPIQSGLMKMLAIGLGWGYNSENLRAMIMQDTKHLTEVLVSESLIPELEHCADV